MFEYASKFNQNLCDWDMSSASVRGRFCDGGANCFPAVGCNPSYEPFTTYWELHRVVRDYCANKSGWKYHSKFDKYG